MISSSEQTRPRLALSRNQAMPTIAVPAVPMPTKVAYTVAAGSRLTASANRKFAGIANTRTTKTGAQRDNGAAHFSAKGHATSNTSAVKTNNQAIRLE